MLPQKNWLPQMTKWHKVAKIVQFAEINHLHTVTEEELKLFKRLAKKSKKKFKISKQGKIINIWRIKN